MRKVRNTEKESKYQKCMRNTKKYQHYKMNENYKKVSEIQKCMKNTVCPNKFRMGYLGQTHLNGLWWYGWWAQG